VKGTAKKIHAKAFDLLYRQLNFYDPRRPCTPQVIVATFPNLCATETRSGPQVCPCGSRLRRGEKEAAFVNGTPQELF
jgi:hypothetical protein